MGWLLSDGAGWLGCGVGLPPDVGVGSDDGPPAGELLDDGAGSLLGAPVGVATVRASWLGVALGEAEGCWAVGVVAPTGPVPGSTTAEASRVVGWAEGDVLGSCVAAAAGACDVVSPGAKALPVK